MAYFTLAHVAAALDYFEKNGHTILIPMFAMLTKDIPVSNDPAEMKKFESGDENAFMTIRCVHVARHARQAVVMRSGRWTMSDCCPACQDNADARRRAEADLAEAVRALADLEHHATMAAVVIGDVDGVGEIWERILAARALLDRHRAPETWRRGGGAS